MTDQKQVSKQEMQDSKRGPRNVASIKARATSAWVVSHANAALCWPFPAGSQNDTDKAVKLKPYVPPKRRTLNQY
jgi:hypothetical protein